MNLEEQKPDKTRSKMKTIIEKGVSNAVFLKKLLNNA